MPLINLDEYQNLPKFSDGRINYTSAKKAPVIVCVVKCKEEILILKRSEKVLTYKNLWSFPAGFIDRPISLNVLALEELKEELGVKTSQIEKILWAKPYEFKDKCTWVRYVCLVELLEKPEIKLNEEHSEYLWIKPEKLIEHDCVPGNFQNLEALQPK